MKPEVAGINGIGPMVREYVHERNAARKARDAAATTAPPPRTRDTVELSAEAMARFRVWQAKHAAVTQPVPEPTPDPVTPGTETPGTESPETTGLSMLV
jgi:hypothetical protein